MRFPIAKRRCEPLSTEPDLVRVFDDFLRYPARIGFGQDAAPAIDVYEKDDKVLASIEIPGLEVKDIKLSVDGNILTVSGEKKEERETKKDSYYRIESSYGKFKRSVELPFDVKAEGAKAVYKNGILKVELPKSEAQKEKEIKIDIN